MDYDCSLKTNQFSSLSDTEINETSSKDHRGNINSPYSTSASGYRRHSNIETSPRSTHHYATISSTTNPYLPASEYVYRRRHDEMMLSEAPPKPERKYRNSKRSVSLNAYDGRRLFSPLRTYCVLMKENIEPGDQQNVEDSRNPNINIASGSSSLNNPGRESSKSKSNLENSAAATPTSSAIHKSSTPISMSFSTTTPSSSSPHKFNSLPRERFIRIEREDGDGNASMNIEKYSSLKYPSKKSEVLLGKSHQHHLHPQQHQQISGSSREKNVTRVPIFKDDNEHDRFSSSRNFPSISSSSTAFPAKNKIERSQSYKEISSSRPYPYYHHYHPQNNSEITSKNMQPQSIQFATSNNAGSASATASENIRYRFPDKSSSTADLNFMPSGTSTLPNFRTRTSGNKGQNVSVSASVWNEKKDQTTNSNSRPNHFFQSDFGDDESDVVIENFIKTHSSNSNSNTLPKRKYPPSTTHISNSNTPQRDKEYSYGEQEHTSMKSNLKSSFQQDSLGDNYLRQCSTFPRGGVRTRSSKHEEVDTFATSPQAQPLSSALSPKQTETLPKPYKNRNPIHNHSFDFPKGYSNVEKIDVFFQPSSSSSSSPPTASGTQFDVPKQSNQLTASERLVPIKMMAGPGSSATLPHPYIRRNKQMTVAPPLEKSPVDQGPFPITSPGNPPDESGPSISQVEMEIERDIFYQKTRSLDRVRPSSKSKLKSVLSIGKSSNGGVSADQSNAHQSHHYPMEIDYSDSQPYFNKGRRDESLFAIDQVDRNYANGRSNSSNIISNGNSSKSIHATGNSASDQLLLEPQQIHSAPIPSPRLKRKGKLPTQPITTGSSSISSSSNTLCSPKINGDEMSSSSSNIHSTSKLGGIGTNYGSKKLSSTSSSGRLVNEPDHYHQHQTTSTSSSIRNDLDILRKTNGGGSGGSSGASNPISLGNTSLNASRSSSTLPNSSSKLSLVKETSIHADNKNHHHQHQHYQTVSIGMSNSGDGIQSEKSSVTNYISQPSTTSATPNYSNSDGPGVNFMISNSQSPGMSTSSATAQFNSMQQLQQPLTSASSSSPKYFSESKTKAQTPAAEQYSNTNKKSALATTADASSKLNKAVRFEPHVIAMEIELEQRKLLQQQLSGVSAATSGGAPSSPQLVNNNNVMTATINSNSSGSNNANGGKSNTGNHMHRHGSQHNGNKSTRQNQHQQHQQHYVHASSYLPVLYHSYHQQQHKYIRKGASGTVAGSGTSGKKNKSKKYKGFVARAIAKVKSKAAAAALVSSASTNKKGGGGGVDSSPTVYYPVGKQEKNNSSSKSEEVLQNYNANSAPSSVITYISPQPQAHEQPPVQQSLDESSAIALQQQYQKVPSITVSPSSEEVADSSLTSVDHQVHSETPLKKGILVKTNSQTQKGVGVGLTKIISESSSPHGNKPVAKYVITPAGRLKKNLHKINAKNLPSPKISSTSTRRMDGYLDENMDQGLYSFGPSESDERHPKGLPIPSSSFTLQTDEITPSSTSSSSSSFTSNLQESYELFHNQTLPDRVAHELSQNAGEEDKDNENIDDPHERCDSLDEDDEDSDNIDDEGPSPFKSFDESDFDEDEDADFVFYPTPKSSSSSNNFNISKQPLSNSASSSAKHLIDTDHHDHLNKAITTSIVTSTTDAHAPFGSNINETTTKGNNGNNNHHHQYSDSTSDRAKSNNVMKKGKSKTEPKMVVGIPTYRSPNSTRAPHHQHPINSSHHGKSQTSIPNANPTISLVAQENVKHKFKEPHPLQHHQLNQEVLLHQEEFTSKVSANENINDLDNAISSQPMHKDSSRVHTKLSSEDVSLHERKGLLLSQQPQHHHNTQEVGAGGKPLQQHIKNENQVDVDVDEELLLLQSHPQPFVPFNDKRSISKGRHESQADAVIHRNSTSLRACEHEHEKNVDHHVHHDEDTLQKDVKNASAATTTSTGGVPMSLNGAESCKERVDDDDDNDNPHDAKPNGKGFLQSLSTSERIASATTKENSTGNTNNVVVAHNKSNSTKPKKTIPSLSKNDIDEYEGRLTDLTTTITRSSSSSNTNSNNGQQLEGLEEKLEEVEEEEKEEGLHQCCSSSASAKYLKEDDDKKAPTHSNSNNVGGEQKLNSSGESSQARTSSTSTSSSWASKNVEKKNHKSVTTTKNFHQEQAQHLKDKKDKDVERLARLELVKKQQNLISKDFETLLSTQSVENENDCEGSGIGSNSISTTSSSPQPNSLETQFGNDQSFLSESEISSVGKSPSPSPRFKSRSKNKISKGGGGRLVPKFKTGSKVAGGECDSGSEEEGISRSHLLNAHQTQSQVVGRQSQSKSREIAEEEEEDSPLFSPDSGPFGMSMLPPQQQQHSATSSTSLPSGSGSSDVNNFIGKFKSRVLLNSDDLEDDEELAQQVADAIHNNKGLRNNSDIQRVPSVKRNITTVEISGDVGIVSSGGGDVHNLQNVVNTGGSGGGGSGSSSHSAVSRQTSLSNDHLQSSGLSLILQPTSIDLNTSSSDEDDSIEKPIEPQIRTKLINNEVDNQHHLIGEEELLEVGSSVSANESSGDNDTEKTTTSDDNSSDWQSESTNTVIFRGNPKIKNGDYPTNTNSDTDIDPCPPSMYGNSNSYLDPEIQINNITIGDDYPAYHQSNHNNGNDVTSTSSNTSPPELSNKSSNAKVSVGYKATKVSKVSTDLIIGIKKSSADNDSSSGSSQSNNSNVKVGSKRKFDKNNDVSSSSSSSSSSSTVDSSEELGKSNETLTDINEVTTQDHVVLVQLPPSPEDQEHLELEMVMQGDTKVVNGNSSRLYVPSGNSNKSPHQRRESPEGQEQEVPDHSSSEKDNKPRAKPPISEKPSGKVVDATLCDMKMEEGGDGEGGGGGDGNNGKSKKNGKSSSSKGSISKERIVQSVLSQIPNRSSPDGADADKSDRDATPEPEVESPTPGGVIDSFDVTSDEDSWVEEILFEDEDETSFEEAVKKLPPPLDLTLHTIVEESCEESEAENSGNFYQPSTSGIGGSQKNHSLSQSDSNANELEKYFNFGIYNDHGSSAKNSLPNEESEFSDTFSESSFSLQEEDFDNGTEGLLDPAELASTRLEKYFYNLGVPQSMMNPMSSTMNQHADSDSVGSESDSDNSVLEKRKKVLKHHRRSADFEEEFGDKVSDEEDSFVFGQDGFDTIKKTARKTKKSGSEGSISNDSTLQQSNQSSNDNADTSGDPSSVFENKSPKTLKKSDSSDSSKTSPSPSNNEKPVIKVNRSNSFTWSSDEEVNIMMSKLRQLIKNLIKSKAEAGSAQSSGVGGEAAQSSTSEVGGESRGSISKDKQLVYLENELIRLMKTDNLKNIVEYLSSEESDVDDVYKFIKVVNSSGSTPVDLSDLGDLGDLDIDDPNLLENLQSTMQLQEHVPGSPKSSPALLAKVMHHIGNRLNMWMKDEGNLEDDNNDDSATIKCAPSVSSDLNEDRFSWKGSFESALAAKRQSVGSTDSISSSDYGPDKSMLRSSSLHHLTTSQPIEENREEEEPSSSLPRMTNLCNSLPRLNQPANPAISRAHSLVMTAKSEQPPGTETYPISISGPVKSARYRPPGFQPSMKAKRIDTEEKASPAILSQSTPVLTQDPAMLKNRSDSMGSIFHDVKPLISVKGQVEFGLQYNYKLACLEVKVVGCRDLAAADSKRNRSDPYVKAYLLPDKSKAGKRKTKTKKNTLSPAFDEILKFPLTLSDLQNRTLWLSVWHSDMFGKNEFLGEVLVNLKDRVFDDPNPGWWDLQEMSGQMEDMPKGDVVIALKWQPKTDSTGNLSVLVKEAKNLVPVKNGSPSTFVKCENSLSNS
ncbi:unnamed protein product [Orchesella dallaii]